jgi:hypothetical protein
MAVAIGVFVGMIAGAAIMAVAIFSGFADLPKEDAP